ncbi:MAG: circadian clock KaiB family protein [Bacteroidales bacterium]|nr:circadian clock KaiB family protein [Bacteroidales bacterium]
MKKNKQKNETPEKFEQLMPERNQSKYTLRLYITGTTNRSILAITNLKKICEEYLEGQYDLEVIDLYKNPGLAKGDQIIAAPTLIKELPLPFRRIIGDMSNKENVLLGLDIREVKEK